MTQPAKQAALAALKAMVYEVTHLSPQEENGAHKCVISADTLTRARAAIEALTAEQATAVDAAECVRCGCTATHELRPPQVTDEWSPYCASCMNDEYATCEAVAQHEISNFGGAYGVPTLESRALTAPAKKEGE
jgi:hypothetical protein